MGKKKSFKCFSSRGYPADRIETVYLRWPKSKPFNRIISEETNGAVRKPFVTLHRIEPLGAFSSQIIQLDEERKKK